MQASASVLVPGFATITKTYISNQFNICGESDRSVKKHLQLVILLLYLKVSDNTSLCCNQ